MPDAVTTDNTQVATTTDVKPSESLLTGVSSKEIQEKKVAQQTEAVYPDQAAKEAAEAAAKADAQTKSEADAKAKADAEAKAKADAGKTPEQLKAEADKKAADEQKAKDEAATKGSPEKYEIKAPQGVTLDSEGLTKLESLARKGNLSNEFTQQIADLGVEVAKKGQAAQLKAWADTRAQWAKDIAADPLVGNNKSAVAKEVANRGVAHVLKIAPELKQAMDQGLIDQPGIYKAFYVLGQMVSEDRMIDGTPSSTAKTPADVLYPKS